MSEPFISCLMVSRGERYPAAHAIDCYRRQVHRPRELLIVSTREDDPVAALARESGDPSIRHVAVPPASLGELRNAAVAHARGDWIMHWDDDDLHHRDRIARQIDALRTRGVKVCFLRRILAWWPEQRMIAITQPRTWEGTMLAHRAIVPAFPAWRREEDMFAVDAMLRLHPAALIDWPEGYCYAIHGRNTNQPPHFEGIFRFSTPVPGAPDYDRALAELASQHDFEGYRATMGTG